MNDAQTKARVGRPADQAKRQIILDALSGGPEDFFEIGTPPYAVSDIAKRLDMDPSNLRKALLQLEKEGLVLRERRKVDVWNAIAQDNQERTCLCFWSAATRDQDRLNSEAWKAGSGDRSRAAFESVVFGRSAAAK